MEFDNQILDFEDQKIEVEQILAGKGTRLANYILDQLVLQVLGYSFVFLSSWLYSFSNIIDIDLFVALIAILMYPAYYIIFESLLGRTPAKFLTRTIVVTVDGRRPTPLNIVGRSLCRFIPFEPFSFLGTKPYGWHDSISRTRVVEADLWIEPQEELV